MSAVGVRPARALPPTGSRPLHRAMVRCVVLSGLMLSAVPRPPTAGAAPGPTFPFDATEARARQTRAAQQLGVSVERTVPLPGGLTLTLVLVPAGSFTMGAPDGESALDPDEGPLTAIDFATPLWVGKCEITNAQLQAFDPTHDSRFMDTRWKDRVGPGIPLNGPEQPVVRVSWHAARGFCRWLAAQTQQPFRLPTEPEWEYACRAGTATPFSCPDAELQRYANFADASLGGLKPWAPRDTARNDGAVVTATVGRYLPNAWGLCDMHGNAAEWCQSVYGPYPLPAGSLSPGDDDPAPRAVRGGSWDDRPRRCRSAFRLSYPPDYAVYNVGFRVVCPAAA